MLIPTKKMIMWLNTHKILTIAVFIFVVVGFIILLAIAGIAPHLERYVPILIIVEVTVGIINIGIDILKHVHPEPQLEQPTWKHRSNRKALRHYLEQLIEEHKYFTFLGRAKPLDLEKIYIALRIGEYVPRQLQPDESMRSIGNELPKQRSGTVEVHESLRLNRHLAVLGEPGSGKTTILKYLALHIAKRDPSLGEFARKMVPNRLSRLANRVHRLLAKVMIINNFGFFCYFIAFGLWILSDSSNPELNKLIGIVLLFILFFIPFMSTRNTFVFTVVSVFLLMYSALARVVSLLAVGAVALYLTVVLYPYWIQTTLTALILLRERMTSYPLPLYLTLNDLSNCDEHLEAHLTKALHEVGFAHSHQFLQQKLDRGECIILLDALDEVVDETAYRQVINEINRFAVSYHRNQIIVTSRIAGFRGLLQGFLQLEVQEFNEEQIALFIRNWFADSSLEEQEYRVDDLLRCLERSARMQMLATNPLLLSIIALLYERNFILPERRVDLYDECTKVMLETREHEKGLDAKACYPPEKKRSALQSIAAHFHKKGIRIFSENMLLNSLAEVLPSIGYPATHNREFLNELMERSGLLRKKSRTSYDFAHLTFQEFFTAADFHERGDAESLLKHIDEPWWREVILLFIGLQEDATQLLEHLRKDDILLAAASLADARPVNTDAFERVAGEIIDELKHLMEKDSQNRQEIADALAEIARWGATEYLVQKARAEEEPPVALAAVLGLARAADRAVLNRLLDPLGPVLHLLNGSLGRFNSKVDERILLLLETLGFPIVFVPAGEFLMGSNEFSNERPPHQVYLDDYWIDKYPVTNAQFSRFVKETSYIAQGNWRSRYIPGKENHPVINVTWYDAVAFCEWAGMSLLNEAQWEKAARGIDGRTYPWGDQWDASRCNMSRHDTTPVNKYPNGVSTYGCYDMVGNVNEWCTDWYDNDYYKHSPERNPIGPAQGMEYNPARVLRGGRWGDAYENCLRAAYRYGYKPPDCCYGAGFRCAISCIPQNES